MNKKFKNPYHIKGNQVLFGKQRIGYTGEVFNWYHIDKNVEVLNEAYRAGYDQAESDMRKRAEPLLKRFGI